MNNLFETLKERGYLYQCTNENEIKKMLNGGPISVYVGIDPTADSLHIGHFFSLMMLKYFQNAGHKVIVLIGGATAMIGDPTGRKDLRQMISKEKVEHNINEIKQIISRFVVDIDENPAIIVNNADWFKGYDYIDFMREVGTHFNVNVMLSAEAYKNRLAEGGLTFLEMGYMLMQAYDFVYLNDKYGCSLQIGGSDQWGNMIAGVELGRKISAISDKKYNLEALTCPLLTNSEGEKMGKTAKGALWVAREKTSVYDFYQYFYNVPDKDTFQLLKLFTRLSLEEIENLINSDIREAKRVMAFEITKVVHGEESAKEALETAQALFTGGEDLTNAPKFEISKEEIENGMNILDLCVLANLISSKSEGRRLIEQNGLTLNGEKVLSIEQKISSADFEKEYALFKKGKKSYLKVVIK